jgi:hypothetical protein
VKKYRLRDGDVISLGVHELVYHDLRTTDEYQGGETGETINDDTSGDQDDHDSAVNETR